MKTLRVPLLIVLVLALLAGGFALMRKSEIIQERTPADFIIENRNNLAWDPSTGVFEVTGGDPYGTVEIPSTSFPLDELRLEFTGPAQPGGWYIYSAPEHLPTKVDRHWVMTATVETTPTGHALVWALPASLLARVDFPDELQIPMTLERAVFRTRFASSASVTFSAAVIAASLSLLLLLWIILRPLLSFRPLEWIIVLALLAAKLWLTSDIGLSLRTYLMHDDLLFMNQGASIHAGNWLGDYWQLTLAKGPTYSIFIALSAATGLSLQFNEVLFHGLASIVFVWALSPWIRRPEWRLLLLMVLLFEAHALSPELIGRVLRGAIQPALTMFTLAGLLGMVTRANQSPKWIWPWALLAGLAGSAFWYSREEGIWLAPTTLLLIGTFAWTGWQRPAAQRAAWLVCILLPLVVFMGARLTLRTINHSYYGVPVAVDVSDGAFPEAYGAMLRVESPDPLPGVPITSTTRKLIYPHSPAFAELGEALDGPLTSTWGKPGWDENSTHPRAYQEIRGGWYQWAIRQAAVQKGHYESAPANQAYWQRVADEINAAVDSGALAGGSRRHGFFPVWQNDYLRPVFVNWFKALDLIVRFTDFVSHGLVSEGSDTDVYRHARFLNEDPVVEPHPATAGSHIRTILHRVFSILGWPLTVFALFATCIVLKRGWSRVEARPQVAVLLALWGGAAALLIVVALVHATSFWALTGNYLGPVVPLIFSCWILAPLFAWGNTAPANPSSSS